MLVSEEYPWPKLWREYAMFCAVGCINVAIFFLIYWFLYSVRLSETYPAGSAWAVAYFISAWQSHFMHRWLTFESRGWEISSHSVSLSFIIEVLSPNPPKILAFQEKLDFQIANHLSTIS